MLYVKNVPGWERAARFVMGAGLSVIAVTQYGASSIGYAIGALGVMAAMSGVLGFCRPTPSSNASFGTDGGAMSMAASRQNLILRAENGDAPALDRLLVECRSDVRRYALRDCATSEVDDAMQETLLVVARHVRSTEGRRLLAGWLFIVVRRECQRLSRGMFAHEDLADARVETWLAVRSMMNCAWSWSSRSNPCRPIIWKLLCCATSRS